MMAPTNMDDLPPQRTAKCEVMKPATAHSGGGGTTRVLFGRGRESGGALSETQPGPATESRFPIRWVILFVAMYGVGVALCIGLGLATDGLTIQESGL